MTKTTSMIAAWSIAGAVVIATLVFAAWAGTYVDEATSGTGMSVEATGVMPWVWGAVVFAALVVAAAVGMTVRAIRAV